MIITVFGATGQVGKRIVQKALANGHTVRAFGRNVNDLIDKDLANDKLIAIKGGVFDEEEVYDAVKGADGVLSALGGAFDGKDKTRSLGIKTIAAQMNKAGLKKIVVLSGSGVLSTPEGGYILNAPGYPPEYLPVGKEHLQAYLYLKETSLDWTVVCSPDIHDEEATNNYITTDTYPPETGKQFITAGDLAGFMVNELEQPKHIHQRVGITCL